MHILFCQDPTLSDSNLIQCSTESPTFGIFEKNLIHFYFFTDANQDWKRVTL